MSGKTYGIKKEMVYGQALSTPEKTNLPLQNRLPYFILASQKTIRRARLKRGSHRMVWYFFCLPTITCIVFQK